MTEKYLNTQQLRERWPIGLTRLTQVREQHFIEGVHFTRYGGHRILWNWAMIQDWLHTRQSPELHQAAIERFLATLPSYQSKKAKPPKAMTAA
jgi:hypothetical protein